jgi:hypothetical protein
MCMLGEYGFLLSVLWGTELGRTQLGWLLVFLCLGGRAAKCPSSAKTSANVPTVAAIKMTLQQSRLLEYLLKARLR